MQKDDNRAARPSASPGSPSDSDHDTSSGAFLPSARLRDKLKKLANQRLDLSSIEFANGASEVHGGYATVSRALLVSTSSDQAGTSQSNSTKNDRLDFPGPTGEASHDHSRKDVAVKKMKMSEDPARVLGLALREAEFLVGLSHENIVELEGFVEDLSKDVVWLVFPWEENGNLKDFIASAEWEIPERISLINDVARGVEYLHSRQPPIRHGDLKSINILINAKYRAVITDFGSARRHTTEDRDKETNHDENKPQPGLSLEPAFCDATNTMTLTLKKDNFTLRWAAPELLRNKATLASDIWALGCVIYEVMTNSIPFHDVDVANVVVLRIITGNLPSLTNNVRLALIRALCSLVLACWSEDPRKRPTAEDCQNSIDWLPMIRPDPIQTPDTEASRARSPGLLMNLGHMYGRQGDYVNASDCFTKALDCYREIGNSKGKAEALVELAQMHGLRNEYSQAATFYTKALQTYIDIGDRQGRADALQGLANVHRARNEYTQAVTFYTKALQICTDIGDRQGRVGALQGLADVHRARNEYTQAVTFYTEALQICINIGDRHMGVYALSGLAGVHRARNEYSQAVAFYTQALRFRTDIGDRRGRADALSGLAEVHRLRNEYTQAVTFYTEAIQIRTDIGDRKGRADALWGLADMHRLQNEYSQAVAFYTEDLQIRTDIGDRKGRADALCGLADVHRLQNQYSQAVAFFTEALQIRTNIGDRQGRADALSGLAEVHRLRNEYTQAVTFYTEALQIRTDIGNRQGRADALRGLAGVHRLQHQYSQAITLFSEALEISTAIADIFGKAYSLLGLAEAHRDQGTYRDAIDHYAEAAEVFGQIGNNQITAYVSYQVAKVHLLSKLQEAKWWFLEAIRGSARSLFGSIFRST